VQVSADTLHSSQASVSITNDEIEPCVIPELTLNHVICFHQRSSQSQKDAEKSLHGNQLEA